MKKIIVLFLMIFLIANICYGEIPRIAKVRERIKNLILFHTDKFDPNNPDDVALASKIAANVTIAMAQYLETIKDAETNLTVKTKLNQFITILKEDATFWNPDEKTLIAVPIIP